MRLKCTFTHVGEGIKEGGSGFAIELSKSRFNSTYIRLLHCPLWHRSHPISRILFHNELKKEWKALSHLDEALKEAKVTYRGKKI